MTKLQSGLKFKSEQQVDDAIKKLEQRLQAQTQRLSLTEEKRVVGEISTLKASKRNIQEFAAAKEKFDSERARQGKLRDQREEYFKRLSEIREEESHVKSLLDGLKGKQDEAWAEYKQRLSKKDAIRKEIDELYAKKKELVAQNKKQLDVYFEGIRSQKKARYEEETRRKEEERRIAHEAYQKEMSEFLKTREPYKTERDRCSALISYLTPLGSSVVVGAGSSAVSGSPTVSNLAPVRSDEFKSPQGIFRRKKDDEDNLSGYFGGTGKGKKGKKGKRVAAMQKGPRLLNHNTEIFGQFISLELQAPKTSAEVQGVIQQLIDKRVRQSYLYVINAVIDLHCYLYFYHGLQLRCGMCLEIHISCSVIYTVF
jgi:hypothetical protein